VVVSSHIPLFPLNTVLVPGLVLPLHIFEPRYRLMIQELLEIPDEEERKFGIVAVRDGHEISSDGINALHPVGTSTILREANLHEDGRYDVVTTGSRRFRITSLDTSSPLLRAEVEWLPEPETAQSEQLTLLTQKTIQDFAAYRVALSGDLNGNVSIFQELPTDPTVVSYLLTAAILLPTAERQDLLAAQNTQTRLALIRTLLRRETALIRHFGALPAVDLFSNNHSLN
jgi:Lon protease-like protein